MKGPPLFIDKKNLITFSVKFYTQFLPNYDNVCKYTRFKNSSESITLNHRFDLIILINNQLS